MQNAVESGVRGRARRRDTEWFKVARELADGGVTAVILSFAECSGGWCKGGVCHDREFTEGGAPWQEGTITGVAGLSMQGFPSRQGLHTLAGQRL